MKLRIKEALVDYTSDYPEGWMFSAGDPYKFPVTIHGTACFIKRFEKKDPASITGWGLLKLLKGKYHSHLPIVYDIREETEKGAAVNYVFYEYLPGRTIEGAHTLRTREDIRRLAGDVLKALAAVHKLGYWFSDFCEKNIFRDGNGRSLLIDLDSTYPVTDRPKNDMQGSKEFWIDVLRFLQLRMPEMQPGDIYGPTLNYFQLLFLILKSRYELVNKGKTALPELSEWLIRRMAVVAPDAPDLFGELQKAGAQLPGPQLLQKIKQMADTIVDAPDNLFSTTPEKTRNTRREPKIRNTRRELKTRNGRRSLWSKWKTTPVVLSAAGILALLFLVFAMTSNRVLRIKTTVLYQDSFIVIRGGNLPDLEKVHVFFDEKEADQKALSSDEFVVTVPDLPAARGKMEVRVVIKGPGGKNLLSTTMEYVPVVIHDPDVEKVYEDSTLTFTGERLDSRALAVFFGRLRAPVVSAHFDRLVVRVPNMGDEPALLMQVRRNDSTIVLQKRCKLEISHIALMDHLSSAQWDAGTFADSLFRVRERLHFPVSRDESRAMVRTDNMAAEDGISYRLLRMYPMPGAKGSIRGFIRPGNGWFHLPYGRKQFRTLLGYELYTDGSSDLDRENFQVYIHFAMNGKEEVRRLLDTTAGFTGELKKGWADFPSLADADFFVELRINAPSGGYPGQNPNAHSSVWVNPSVLLRQIIIK